MSTPAPEQTVAVDFTAVERTDVRYNPALGASTITVTVAFPFAGVDRPVVGGWTIPDTDAGRRLAARLRAAIMAGVATVDPKVMVDVHGDTYVQARHVVSGRTMNADLTRLGY